MRRSTVSVRRRWKLLARPRLVVVALIAGGLYWRSHRATKLDRERHNRSRRLHQHHRGCGIRRYIEARALRIQLEQSPFLDLVSDRKVNANIEADGPFRR